MQALWQSTGYQRVCGKCLHSRSHATPDVWFHSLWLFSFLHFLMADLFSFLIRRESTVLQMFLQTKGFTKAPYKLWLKLWLPLTAAGQRARKRWGEKQTYTQPGCWVSDFFFSFSLFYGERQYPANDWIPLKSHFFMHCLKRFQVWVF